jgi:hypothetical protein
MKGRTLIITAAVVLGVAGGLPSVAAGSDGRTGVASASVARWCPDGECRAPGTPRSVPTQARPRIQPQLTRNGFGREAYRSGGWLME